MQFVILLTGAMVFAFHVYVKPPVMFHEQARRQVASSASFQSISAGYDAAFEARRQAAERSDLPSFRAAQKQIDTARKRAMALAGEVRGEPDFKDTNYIFLSFVTRYMPVGIVGLVMAVILAAAMSTTSAEMNSLATVTVIDVYKRFAVKGASDRHYLLASRIATAFWGVYAVTTAQYAKNLGSLVEAVNRLGSLFYGGLLGVFTLAFFFPRVKGTAAFSAVLIGEAAIFSARYFTTISFLWYNVVGAVVVVLAGLALSFLLPEPRDPAPAR
jgi:Na+/proline symporter